jgi:glycosyltransferase involved in cell wall biosynthesis
MKLIIQIPAWQEEGVIGPTVEAIPKAVPGFDAVEVLVIADGCTDRTVEEARAAGAHHVLVLKSHVGLATAFSMGLERALELGADVIVNTDADGQYPHEHIPDLLRPILDGRADLVIGDRQTGRNPHFAPVKRVLQKMGSALVGRLIGQRVADAPSGFRAMSREVARRIHVFSTYTYTLETIIQSARMGFAIAWVPIRTNPPVRKSRLVRSTWGYITRVGAEMLRIVVVYNPLKTFLTLSLLMALPGLFFFGRFLLFYFAGHGSGHVQSLIAGAVSLLMAFQCLLLGILADLNSINRRLLEHLKDRPPAAPKGKAGFIVPPHRPPK